MNEGVTFAEVLIINREFPDLPQQPVRCVHCDLIRPAVGTDLKSTLIAFEGAQSYLLLSR